MTHLTSRLIFYSFLPIYILIRDGFPQKITGANDEPTIIGLVGVWIAILILGEFCYWTLYASWWFFFSSENAENVLNAKMEEERRREKKIEEIQRRLDAGWNPGSGSRDCEVGTGGWGLGKCENQGIYQCPRCGKYCCNNHKSWVRTYQGEPVCEPCSRGMQHT